ncbi:hypothetical protein D3C76_1213740 [compost metagenome]
MLLIPSLSVGSHHSTTRTRNDQRSVQSHRSSPAPQQLGSDLVPETLLQPDPLMFDSHSSVVGTLTEVLVIGCEPAEDVSFAQNSCLIHPDHLSLLPYVDDVLIHTLDTAAPLLTV